MSALEFNRRREKLTAALEVGLYFVFSLSEGRWRCIWQPDGKLAA